MTRLTLALLFSLAAYSTGSAFIRQQRTKLGNEVFTESFPPELKQKKLGLVINHTSVLPDGPSLVQALLQKEIRVEAIFSPEHGFSGTAIGGAEVKHSRFQNIQIISLYGQIKKPTPEQARSVDAFVYDIQDVGTRFYTYITTLKYVIEAAAEANRPVYVLDRPNPAGGHIVEGPFLQPEWTSFIGALPIPVRYGLTVGELAMMMKGENWVPNRVDLHVIRMENWNRSFFWEDSGLRWIPPSPNIPSPETALVYPGTGLLGALTINQGLGTLNPFLQVGAPWLNNQSLIQMLNKGMSFGIQIDPLAYTPHSLPGKILRPSYQDRLCHGIRILVIQKDKFLSLRFTLELIRAIKKLHPKKISLYRDSLNRMFGNDLLERYIRGQVGYDQLLKELEKDENLFIQKRRKYLLYD